MPQNTRDRILRAAHDQFYQSGFHAVGLDAILDHVGVTKTTFYKYFETKDDLVRDVLRWHDRWWRDYFAELLRRHGGDSPRARLLAIFDALEDVLTRSDYNGCFFINVAVQFPLQHDPAHVAAADHKRAMEAILRELAAFAGADDPAALAKELSLLMEGVYVTRQITGDPASSHIARQLAIDLIDRRIPVRAIPKPAPTRRPLQSAPPRRPRRA